MIWLLAYLLVLRIKDVMVPVWCVQATSPNQNRETPSTQLKTVQILCVGPIQEIWHTEQERGKPHGHKMQDIHSTGEERHGPFLPTTAINNDCGTLSQEPQDDTESSHGYRNHTGTCVTAMLPGPTGLPATEGEGPRPALLFSGDNCLNPDAPQALSGCSHHHRGECWVIWQLQCSQASDPASQPAFPATPSLRRGCAVKLIQMSMGPLTHTQRERRNAAISHVDKPWDPIWQQQGDSVDQDIHQSA